MCHNASLMRRDAMRKSAGGDAVGQLARSAVGVCGWYQAISRMMGMPTRSRCRVDPDA